MAKKDMKEALGASLRAERDAVADRFERAESYFNAKENATGEAKATAAPPREKVIRDGFTMPAGDYALIAQIQAQGLQAGLAVTKSEVLRASLHVLSQMPPAELKQVLMALEKVKTGRPATG